MRISTALVSAITLLCATGLCACDDKGKAPTKTTAATTKATATATATATAKKKEPPFSKLAADKVNKKHKEAAEKFGKDFFDNCTKGKCKALGDEAIKAVKDGFPVDKQKAAYDGWVKGYGKFKELTYVEAYEIPSKKLVAFRFKGVFEKDKPEVRIVIDKDGKVAGFFLIPWKDKFAG